MGAVNLSILIPVFSQWQYTEACLASIFKHSPPVSYEVIVADNGSTDHTPERLRELGRLHRQLRVITFQENLGYSLANNEAARQAQGTSLILLNNDTIVTDGWIPALLEPFARADTGITGPKLVYPEIHTINHAGYVYDSDQRAFYARYLFEDSSLEAVNRERELQALLGACMAIPRELYLDVGGLGELGLEDIDLCLKVRDRGKRVLYIPRATVYHHGSVTLRHSPPGTIPHSDLIEFNRRWPPGSIDGDDLRLLHEDGYGYEHVAKPRGTIRVHDVMSASVDAVSSGLEAKARGDLSRAREEFQRAICIWRMNEDAYEELVVLLVECGQVSHAQQISRDYLQWVPGSSRALLTASQMALLPDPDSAG